MMYARHFRCKNLVQDKANFVELCLTWKIMINYCLKKLEKSIIIKTNNKYYILIYRLMKVEIYMNV